MLNLKTNKIIGIHKGQYKNEDFNCGIYLEEPIKEFQNDINLIINKDKTEFTNEKEKKSLYNLDNINIIKKEKEIRQETSSILIKDTFFPPIPIYVKYIENKKNNQNKSGNKIERYDGNNSQDKHYYKSNSPIQSNTNKMIVNKSQMFRFKQIANNQKSIGKSDS